MISWLDSDWKKKRQILHEGLWNESVSLSLSLEPHIRRKQHFLRIRFWNEIHLCYSIACTSHGAAGRKFDALLTWKHVWCELQHDIAISALLENWIVYFIWCIEIVMTSFCKCLPCTAVGLDCINCFCFTGYTVTSRDSMTYLLWLRWLWSLDTGKNGVRWKTTEAI